MAFIYFSPKNKKYEQYENFGIILIELKNLKLCEGKLQKLKL